MSFEMRRWRNSLRTLVFLWVPAVVGAYYVVHKPWAGARGGELLAAGLDILLAALLLLVAGGIGRRILKDDAVLDPLELFALEAGIGLGILGLVALAAGSAGGATSGAAWAGLLLGLMAFGTSGIRWVGRLRNVAVSRPALAGLGLPASALFSVLIGVSLIQSLAPPLQWDSLVYHLELPKQYLHMGRVDFVSGNLFVGFPQIAEMNFMWAMGLHQGSTAALVGWMVAVVGLVGVAGLARRIVGPRAFWLAPTFLLAGRSLWQGMSWSYVDHWVLLFGVGVFVSVERFIGDRKLRWLLATGGFAGLAIGTKYTAGLLLAAAVFTLAVAKLDHRLAGHEQSSEMSEADGSGAVRWLREAVLVGGTAFLVAAPWLIRNWAQTGNPIYPFLLPGREVDALRQMYQAQSVAGRSLLGDLILPWSATVLGIDGGPRFNTSIGPFYLALIPGLLLGLDHIPRTTRRTIRRFVALALLVWVLWALGSRVADPLTRSRHYYGFFPILAVLSAAGYVALRRLKVWDVDFGWVVEKFVAFSFALVALSAVVQLGRANPLPVVTGHEREADYLSQQLGWFGPVMEAVNELPSESRVKFLWEPRGYYCEIDCDPDVILDQWWYLNRTVGGPEAIVDMWKSEGISHVLIYDVGVRLEKEAQPLLTDDDWVRIDELRNSYLTNPRDFGGAYTLYELR